MNWDEAPEQSHPAAPQGATPPLFAALQWVQQRQWRGRIAFESPEEPRGVLHVGDGRVNDLECDALTPARLIDVMLRAGVLDERRVERLAKISRRTGVDPVALSQETGMVSRATLSAIRESTAREVLLGLLLERNLRARPLQEDLPGAPGRGGDLGLPIPYLLKEAHRRYQEIPSIRQVVTGPDQVFVRTGAGTDSGLPRWEDLPASPAERQVFFFLDGRRSVQEVSLATCQSVHEVGRALASLHASGLVRPLTPTEMSKRRKGDPSKAPGRASLVRLFTLALALAMAIAGLRGAVLLSPPPQVPEAEDSFRLMLRQASSYRVQAARCLFRIREGRSPSDFEEILERQLVLPGDRKAAMMRELLQEAP